MCDIPVIQPMEEPAASPKNGFAMKPFFSSDSDRSKGGVHPMEIEDPSQQKPKWLQVMGTQIWMSLSIFLLIVVVVLAVIVGVLLRRGRAVRPDSRAHVITYSNTIVGAGSATAVQWHKVMPDAKTMAKEAKSKARGTTSTAYLVKKGPLTWETMFYSSGGARYMYSGHSVQAAVYTLYQAYDEPRKRPISLTTPGSSPFKCSIDKENQVIQTVDTEKKTKFMSLPIKEVVEKLLKSDAVEGQVEDYKAKVVEALGIEEEDLSEDHDPIWVFHIGNVILLKDADKLAELTPNFDSIKELQVPGDEGKKVEGDPKLMYYRSRNIIPAVVFMEDGEDLEVHFKFRCLCPRLGIDEDPVTGTAMSAMITLYHRLRTEAELETSKKWYTGSQVSFSPGLMKGQFVPPDKLQIKGPGVIVSTHSLPYNEDRD